MDQLIKQLLQGEIFWYETATPAPSVSPSAFLPYPNTPRIELGFQSSSGCNNGVNSGNMNKRMIEFLRKSWPTTTETKDSEIERCFRHMMNERMRKEKQKKSYFDLHYMLPLGTKKDLERRNHERKSNLAAKIKLRIENPTSGIDSMLEVFKCLKKLDSKPRMIQSKFTNKEFLAVMDIETELSLKKKNLERFVVSVWTIWNDRNGEVHGEQRRPIDQPAIFAKNYLLEFNQAQEQVVQNLIAAAQSWQPPEGNFVKVNFDGARRVGDHKGGIEIVIRNKVGLVMAALYGVVSHVANPFIIEAMAACHALIFARELGFNKIILEGDALTIIKKMQTDNKDLSPIGVLIEEATYLCIMFSC
ncbi:hypothetical protein REPUB_Repub20aG0094100 [Reevesia pubescens]